MRANALPISSSQIARHIPLMCPPALDQIRQQRSVHSMHISRVTPTVATPKPAPEIVPAQCVNSPVQPLYAQAACSQQQNLQSMRDAAEPLVNGQISQQQALSCMSSIEQLRQDALGAPYQASGVEQGITYLINNITTNNITQLPS